MSLTVLTVYRVDQKTVETVKGSVIPDRVTGLKPRC